MNYESDFEQPFFTQHAQLRELEEQLYGHVREAIDFDALYQLEEMLCSLLCQHPALSTELALDVSQQIMQRALVRVANSDDRFCEMGAAPPGITDAEKAAVAFDERPARSASRSAISP